MVKEALFTSQTNESMKGLSVQESLTKSKKAQKKEEVIQLYNLKDGKAPKTSPRKSIFDLRNSSLLQSHKGEQMGRLYSTKCAQQVGGLRVEEMIYGLKMAHLSCTDDSEERLEAASPNSMAALTKIVGGSEATARLPLSQILREKFGLNLDVWIDESGVRKGRPVDTQGFIASNEDTIVLSYRFTTSILDWITNLSMTSSEWEPDVDEEHGHAGFCSCGMGWWDKIFHPQRAKPRVHTAYYNNFIYTIPYIRKYILEPLMKPDATPKTIYVSGCSLGAAISQIAYCFILQELYENLMDPNFVAVKRLVSVTAGSPRVGGSKFRKVMMDKIKNLRRKGLDRAVICRMVYNNDIVPHAPPNILSFHHLDKMVYITKGGEHVMINPDLSKRFSKVNELKTIYKTIFQTKKDVFQEKIEIATDDVKVKVHEVTEDLKEKVHDVTEELKEKVHDVQEKLHPTTTPEEEDKNNNNNNNNEETPPLKEPTTTTTTNEAKTKSDFQIECENAPEAIRDHMPFWYLTFLEKLEKEQQNEIGSVIEEELAV